MSCWCRSTWRNPRRSALPASRCSTTIAMPVPASNSPTPNCSASRTVSSSASAGSRPVRSNIAIAAPLTARIFRSMRRSSSSAHDCSSSGARARCRPWWPVSGIGLMWLPPRRPISAAATPKPAPAQRSAQQDPELRAVVQQTIDQAQCFADQYDSAVWYTLMEPKLRRYVKNDPERLEILQTAHCETHRSEISVLPAGLVMAVLDIESGFDRWAVSSTGAVGLMQVMPFWPEQLGMRRYELTRVAANVSMVCPILP